jgi:hypothetical protein
MDSTITSPFPPPQQPTEPMEPVASAPAPASSLAALAGDTCVNCAAPLASDQRYCLECGERNGEPRVPAMSGRPVLTPIVPAVTSVTSERPARGVGGAGASTALIAGVGTLLLALGVGVLIGHSAGSNQQAKSAAPQIITVGGGAAAGAPTASTATPGDTAAGAGAAAGGAKAGKDKKSGSAGAKAKDSTPTSGAVVKKTPGKVVKVGSKGSGKGYKDGKFTGDFFGN